MTGELLRLTNGSTIGTIGLADVKSIRVAVPPISEQEVIISKTFSQKADLADIVKKVECSIAILNEYRSALITSAVSGKIEGLR